MHLYNCSQFVLALGLASVLGYLKSAHGCARSYKKTETVAAYLCCNRPVTNFSVNALCVKHIVSTLSWFKRYIKLYRLVTHSSKLGMRILLKTKCSLINLKITNINKLLTITNILKKIFCFVSCVVFFCVTINAKAGIIETPTQFLFSFLIKYSY
jgi:hypothetical protein